MLYEAIIIEFESIFVNNWLNRISPLSREMLLGANRKSFAASAQLDDYQFLYWQID